MDEEEWSKAKAGTLLYRVQVSRCWQWGHLTKGKNSRQKGEGEKKRSVKQQHGHQEVPHGRADVHAAASGDEPTLYQFMKDYIPWEGPMLEQGNGVRRQERQKGTVMVWPQPPFPIPLHCLVGKRGRGVKLSLEKGLREDVFLIFVFVSHHPTLRFIGNKLNLFSASQTCLACDSNW